MCFSKDQVQNLIITHSFINFRFLVINNGGYSINYQFSLFVVIGLICFEWKDTYLDSIFDQITIAQNFIESEALKCTLLMD